MTDDTDARNDETGADETAKRPGERWVKLAFLLVALAIAGWLVARPYFRSGLNPKVWGKNFDRAMTQAKQNDRRVVAVLYDSFNNADFEKMRNITLSKAGNIEAMRERNMIPVAVRASRDDAVAKTYGVSTFPTTLLLAPDGTLIVAWEGYIGEIDFRSRFLEGQPQP